jgi:hypothetical protein
VLILLALGAPSWVISGPNSPTWQFLFETDIHLDVEFDFVLG